MVLARQVMQSEILPDNSARAIRMADLLSMLRQTVPFMESTILAGIHLEMGIITARVLQRLT